MVEETVDQLKKQRVIEHMEIALADMQKYPSSPIVINTMVQLHDALVIEYNSLYAPPAVEAEGAHPTVTPKKGEKKD